MTSTTFQKSEFTQSSNLNMQPYTRLGGVYLCYAELLSSAQPLQHYTNEIKIIKDSEQEGSYFALNNFHLLYQIVHKVLLSSSFKYNISLI